MTTNTITSRHPKTTLDTTYTTHLYQLPLDNRTGLSIHEPTTTNQLNFSQEMLQQLLAAGLTKQTIAKQLQTTVTTINRIIQGDISNPRPQIFSRLLGLYCQECY